MSSSFNSSRIDFAVRGMSIGHSIKLVKCLNSIRSNRQERLKESKLLLVYRLQ